MTSNNGFLTRDAILAVQDIPFEDVDIPAWGGKVRVRGLTAKERDDFENNAIALREIDATKAADNIRARLVVLSLVDSEGNRLFTNDEAEALGKKHGAVVDRLYWAARRLSAFDDKDIETLIKNSAPGLPVAASGESL